MTYQRKLAHDQIQRIVRTIKAIWILIALVEDDENNFSTRSYGQVYPLTLKRSYFSFKMILQWPQIIFLAIFDKNRLYFF